MAAASHPSKEDVVAEFRRRSILDAACHVFGDKGFELATVEAVAEAARVAEGTVYLDHPSKQAIDDAVFATGMAEMERLIGERVAAADSARDAIAGFVTVRAEYFQQHPDFFRISCGRIRPPGNRNAGPRCLPARARSPDTRAPEGDGESGCLGRSPGDRSGIRGAGGVRHEQGTDRPPAPARQPRRSPQGHHLPDRFDLDGSQARARTQEMIVRWLVVAALVAGGVAPAAAQLQAEAPTSFRGSVPQGTATAEPLALSVSETLDRALKFNLGLLLQEEEKNAAHGARWRALADLLPNLRANVSERRQVINLEAYRFPAPDPIVGPFNVFDARVLVSQRLVDLNALNKSRAASYTEKAEALGVRSARELVVLVAVNLYLEAISASSRIDVARAQLETAQVLLRQAQNLKGSGIVAGIDVLRADAQVQRQRQRLIVAENDFEKAKLRIGRADRVAPRSAHPADHQHSLRAARARRAGKSAPGRVRDRADYRPLPQRVAAAEARARAAWPSGCQSLTFERGLRSDRPAGLEHRTQPIRLGATCDVPIFEGGRAPGANDRSRRRAPPRTGRDIRGPSQTAIDEEVRSAYLDVERRPPSRSTPRRPASTSRPRNWHRRATGSPPACPNTIEVDPGAGIAGATPSELHLGALSAQRRQGRTWRAPSASLKRPSGRLLQESSKWQRPRNPRRGPARRSIAGVLVVAAIVAGSSFYLGRGPRATDDAQIEGKLRKSRRGSAGPISK